VDNDNTFIIQSRKQSLWQYLGRVNQYRHLIISFARRDIKVRYAQTILGVLWSVIQPLTGLVIFTLFFDQLIKIDTNGVPYPVFAFSGMAAWYFFAYIIGAAGTAVFSSQDIIKKIYFPKLVLPLSKVLIALVELGISLGLLFILMLLMGYWPTWRILFLPFFIVANSIVGLAVAIWLCALTARYRDFHHIIPYLINFGIWLTPVFYPSTLLPEKYASFLYANPMAGIIEGYRWALIGGTSPSLWYVLTFALVGIVFIAGLKYFQKIEHEMADYV